MRRLKGIGTVLLIVGIAVTFMSTAVPYVKVSQTFYEEGPGIKFNENTTYWINIWIIPPIDAGESLFVMVESSRPGGAQITILPSREGEIIAGATPIVRYALAPNQHTYSTVTVVPLTSEYFVFVASFESNFTLLINSRWSPFYDVRTYVYFGLGGVAAGIVILYYDRIKEKQERMLREALQGPLKPS